jgi:hypothetical protein
MLSAPSAGKNLRYPNRLGQSAQLRVDLGLVLRDARLLGSYFLYHGDDLLLLSFTWRCLGK